ncbi:MAG: hypothetical protein JWM11_424 [Planctomycetaceae bacterium]|nr:hypothetical protein [Planctomycetaceae bacterium]
MSIAASPPFTTTDLFAMPDDGVERDLIRGELREYPVTRRNHAHSRITSILARLLGNWMVDSKISGDVCSGEAGVRLSQTPETTVGIDVAYFSAEDLTRTPSGQPWLEGPPTLAVEIISPSDKHEDLVDKVELYLEYGVPMVWIVDPDFQQISIHRRGEPVVTLNVKQNLEGFPELPHFSVPVNKLFSW